MRAIDENGGLDDEFFCVRLCVIMTVRARKRVGGEDTRDAVLERDGESSGSYPMYSPPQAKMGQEAQTPPHEGGGGPHCHPPRHPPKERGL
jgi:hypothetical protein